MILIFIIIIIILAIVNYNIYKKNIENFKTESNIKIYVVNLKKDIERWNVIKNDADKQNLNIVRFDAVDGRKINLNTPKYNHMFQSHKLKAGQKGCALSHITLWNKIKNDNHDIIIVLEDDAIIPKNFNVKLNKYLNQAPNNWDMIILGGNRFKGKYYSKNLIKPVINPYGNWGTFGYMIKKNTANKLLENCRVMKTTIDHHLNLNFYSQNEVYFCNPQIIKHDYNYYSNILQKVRKDDSIRNNKIEIIKN